ncbi:MAG TPA: nodulation protein NfeD [Puia sp.]|nr:nodulation protein NfeD [Puia sp.]
MKLISIPLLLLLPLLLSAQTVIFITLDRTINPATAEFIHRSIEKATREKSECLVIQLNTPGGLLESTRRIVGDMLESPVPVVVFVSPGGAHAGSAGVFITLAAQIAAMAPGTNLGAAHPVDLQGQVDTVMNDKITNDAAAFIRTIAEKRHRNGGWAELAVRKSVSLTESEALAQNVIDLVAKNLEDLLRQIDGKNAVSGTGSVILHTRSARIESLEMGFTEKILDLISNPTITYILLMLGLYGLLFEFYNPGSILPGIVGVISLILAFYSMQTLPVNYAGLALIIFAIILFLLDVKLASHGLLAIGGIVSLLLGSIMLIRPGSGSDFGGISRVVIIVSTAITALFFLTIIGLGLKAQRGKPVTGPEGLIGEIGETLEALTPDGSIRVHGEHWKAESVAGNIEPGKKVRVIRMQDWKLYVERLIAP